MNATTDRDSINVVAIADLRMASHQQIELLLLGLDSQMVFDRH